MPTTEISPDAVYRHVQRYATLGEHRTGSACDHATSQWLAGELQARGLMADLHPWTFTRYDAGRAELRCGVQTMQCIPVWPVYTHLTSPVQAPLARLDGDVSGAIAVHDVTIDAGASVTPANAAGSAIAEAHRRGARAIVIVTQGMTGEVIALNADHRLPEWPIPAVLIGPRAAATLAPSIAAGDEAVLTLDAKAEANATAYNVLARAERGPRLVVVSTPASGWFRCGAERGTGIGLFLELAGWAVGALRETSLLFVATSGHELGGIGMGHLLANGAPAPNTVHLWLHLGAGIAARRWDAGPPPTPADRIHPPILMCTEDVEEALSDAFHSLGMTPSVAVRVGEFAAVAHAGYRAFGLAGAHAYHHTPADGPEMTAPDLIEPFAAALTNALMTLVAAGRGSGGA